MIGQTLSHYQIISRIGAGGMGEVYLAEDRRLGRRIALKVLPDAIAQNQDRLRRFEQEAFAASSLNHPNILTIYEFGAEGDTHFLASEFIDGETLRERLEGASLELSEAVDIAAQIAQALAAAHKAKIIHRDIKPENVMIRKDGIVKVLDFGLAKLLEAEPLDLEAETRKFGLTQAGTVMGTVAYMSPEQARGKKVDARSDVFSFGAMLYEMLSGRQPFTGETINHIIVAILEKEPAPLAQSIPGELAGILKQALAKRPDERYENAQSMLADLKKLQMRLLLDVEHKRESSETERTEAQTLVFAQTTSDAATEPTAAGGAQETKPEKPKSRNQWLLVLVIALALCGGFLGYRSIATNPRQIESIAVLPFVNTSGNADVEYLSDGMTETLIGSLSQLPNLSVKARSTVFYYKGKDASPKQIGSELGVQAVLLGRVAQRGNDLKLSLELVNTSTQDVIWSEQYDRQTSDLITLQSEIARDVSTKLKTKLSGADVAKVTRIFTADPRAYELYLKGKFYTNQFTKEGLRLGVENFNMAIVADRNYSRAYSGLAYNYILLDDWFMSPHESVARARENAERAKGLDETDVDAHVVLALVAHWYDWDWARAESEFKRALELNPENPESYSYYAYFLSSLKRHDEALAIARQGLQIDPLSSLANFTVGSALLFSRRWDDTITHFQNAIKIDPNYWFHHSYLGRAYEQKGMMPEALAAFQRGVEADREQSENWAGLAHAYAVTGKTAEARQILHDLLKKSSEGSYVSPYSIATIYAGLGEDERTFAWLERAYSERSYYLPVYLTSDERLDRLRSDSRFKDLLRRIKLPE